MITWEGGKGLTWQGEEDKEEDHSYLFDIYIAIPVQYMSCKIL